MAGNGKKLHADSKKRVVKFKQKFSWKNLLLYFCLLLFALFFFSAFTSPYENIQTVPVSALISDVKSGKVSQIEVTSGKLIATEKNGGKIQADKEQTTDVYTMFKDAGVSLSTTNVTVKDESGVANWINITSAVVPGLLMIGFFYFMFRQARGT